MTTATGSAEPVATPPASTVAPPGPALPRADLAAGPALPPANLAAGPALPRADVAAGPAGWRAVAAFGALASGLLHGAVAVAHAGHGPGYVLGFAAVGGAQLVLAALLRRRPPPAVLLLAVAATITLIGGYVAGQLGLPVSDPHHRLPSWAADVRLAAVVAELVTVAAVSALLTGRWRSWSLNLALAAGTVLWGLWLLGW